MRRTASSFSALLRDEAASISTAYALMIPILFGAAGVGLDYSRAASERSRMQAVADAAAIAAARELQMAKADPDKIAAVARNYVTAQITDVVIGTKVDTQALKVRVDLNKDIEPTIAKVIWPGKIHLSASATAGMSGGLPLCLIGLDTKAPGTIKLEQNALLTAPGCVVYSNSKSPAGLQSMDDAVLKAGFICSAGGKVQTKKHKLFAVAANRLPGHFRSARRKKSPRDLELRLQEQRGRRHDDDAQARRLLRRSHHHAWRASDACRRDLYDQGWPFARGQTCER
jgi:Flp pilus assembly protein TadG